MKKLLFIAAIAATMGSMTSCTQNEDFTPSAGIESNTIAFSTSPNKVKTRSAETINSISSFTVSAVNNDNSVYFSNEEFTFDGATSSFKSQTPHYWPTTGTLSFYAISNISAYSTDANNVPMYTYNNWEAEKDLVAATVKAGEKEIPYPLTFRHVTSQIYVSAEAENKTEELTYKLVSVKMTAPSTGTYSFANTTGGIGTWSIDNTKTSEYSYGDALPMSFKQNGQIELSSCYWNILPVTDGSLYFKVEYQVYQNNKLISDFTGSKYKECKVENPGLLAGKKYRYNFILSRSTNDEITFTTTVNDWEDGYSTTTTIKEPVEVRVNGHSYVDLGMPSGVLWAKFNVGATSETDYGNYFYWGSVEGHPRSENYVFYEKDYQALGLESITDNLTLTQDAAHVNMGGCWRMPTETEFQELLDNCNSSWVDNYDDSGVNGYLLVSKINGNQIFLPAGGTHSGHWWYFETKCYYYSSTIYTSSPWVVGLRGEATEIKVVGINRTYGSSVRAVCD